LQKVNQRDLVVPVSFNIISFPDQYDYPYRWNNKEKGRIRRFEVI